MAPAPCLLWMETVATPELESGGDLFLDHELGSRNEQGLNLCNTVLIRNEKSDQEGVYNGCRYHICEELI